MIEANSAAEVFDVEEEGGQFGCDALHTGAAGGDLFCDMVHSHNEGISQLTDVRVKCGAAAAVVATSDLTTTITVIIIIIIIGNRSSKHHYEMRGVLYPQCALPSHQARPTRDLVVGEALGDGDGSGGVGGGGGGGDDENDNATIIIFTFTIAGPNNAVRPLEQNVGVASHTQGTGTRQHMSPNCQPSAEVVEVVVDDVHLGQEGIRVKMMMIMTIIMMMMMLMENPSDVNSASFNDHLHPAAANGVTL